MSMPGEAGETPKIKTRPRSPAEALEPARAPSRPRGTKIRRESRALGAVVRITSTVLTVVLGIIALVGGIGALMHHQVEAPGPLQTARTFVIPKGEGRLEIARRLEQEGVVSNRLAFVAAHIMQGFSANRRNAELKAGEYEFKKGASMHQVLDTLIEGKVSLASVLIQPGLTSHAIVEKLKADGTLSGDVAEVPAEGTLLPETYRMSKGMARTELLERMKIDQQRLVAQLWEKRQPNLPYATPEQAVVMASIIERETGARDERERVAAVFVNRLRKNMPLQSDPTILYGVHGGAVQWGKPILRSEIDTKTTHNTYQMKGLPPTPICNPSRQAIEAALNPAATNDLYFVADGQGGHTFSETLKDHNAAVQVWRKAERDMRAAKAEAARAAGQPMPVMPAEADAAAEPGEAAAPAAPPVAVAPAAAASAAAIPLPVRKPKKQ